MATVKLDIKGDRELMRKMAQLDGGMNRVMGTIAEGVGREVENELKRYPGPPSYPIQWASERQRRWYFAQVRAGAIDVPYRRRKSGGLAGHWHVQRRGPQAVVGNPMDYAAYVQSKKAQQPMHKATGWTTDDEAAEKVERSGVIGKVAREVIENALRGIGLA